MRGVQWHGFSVSDAAVAARPQNISRALREVRREGAHHRSTARIERGPACLGARALEHHGCLDQPAVRRTSKPRVNASPPEGEWSDRAALIRTSHHQAARSLEDYLRSPELAYQARAGAQDERVRYRLYRRSNLHR